MKTEAGVFFYFFVCPKKGTEIKMQHDISGVPGWAAGAELFSDWVCKVFQTEFGKNIKYAKFGNFA